MNYFDYINSGIGEITKINASSASFDFLKSEPDLYSVKDLVEKPQKRD